MKIKVLTVALGLLIGGPALAQDDTGLTTTDDTVNAMMADWFVYDEACRGSTPDQGADGFCGAREYIGWTLNQHGVCLAESEDLLEKSWQICNKESVMFEDPLSQVRADIGAQSPVTQ